MRPPNNGRLTFQANSRRSCLDIAIQVDNVQEGMEKFTVQLGGDPDNSRIVVVEPSTATITVDGKISIVCQLNYSSKVGNGHTVSVLGSR